MDLVNFSDTCSYCFNGIEDNVSVCYCGNTLCDRHLELHTSKFSCGVLYSLSYENSHVKVSNAQEDTGDLEERINTMLKNGNAGGCIKRCPHIGGSSNVELSVDGSDAKCAMCDLKDNLWICLECGFVGCGRVQPGIQGNGHALMHFNTSGASHGQVALLSSVHSGRAETFCYLCQEFVHCPFRLNIQCLNLAPRSFDEIAGSEHARTSDKTGIVNEGQNCYISAVLHLLSTVFQDADLDVHFELCESNPTGCFCCQLIKVLNGLRTNKANTASGEDSIGKTIKISDFLKLVFGSEMFVQYKQEDCSEFLQYILESISNYEDSMLIPKITGILDFDVESCSKCSKCDFVSRSACQTRILYVPYTDSLERSVEEYFKPSESRCECEGRIVHSTSILKIPEYAIISVMRYRIEDGKSIKLGDPIEAGTLDLSRFASGSGAQCALDLKGCIVHKGKETSSGHYTWWAKDGEENYLVNDETVTRSTLEWSKNGTVFLLHKCR